MRIWAPDVRRDSERRATMCTPFAMKVLVALTTSSYSKFDLKKRLAPMNGPVSQCPLAQNQHHGLPGERTSALGNFPLPVSLRLTTGGRLACFFSTQ